MGGPQGLSLKVRAEHLFRTSINGFAGSFMPATILTALPPTGTDEVQLTNFLFTQVLSESCAVFFGKLDTADGDLNAFASGRGKEQFSNLALIAPPTPLLAVPYSTLGAGFTLLHEGQPVFVFTVLNPVDTSSTIGLDELFEEGVSLTALLRVPVQLAGRPGVQAVGAAWSSRDFTALGQDPRILTGNVPITERTGTWCVFWSGHHYLHVDPCDPTKGWGVFGRAAVSDGNPNPLEYFLSFGIGGTSPLAGRQGDTFGIGWYRNYLSDELGAIATQLIGLQDGQGVELYYNIAVTPWLHVTPDVQFLKPEFGRFDDTTVAGVRVNVDF
jgi:porin